MKTNTARIGASLLAGSFEAKPLHDPGRYACQWFKSSDFTFINGPGGVAAPPTVISQPNNVSVHAHTIKAHEEAKCQANRIPAKRGQCP